MFNKALIIGILLVGATFSISANEVQKWEYTCVQTSLFGSQLAKINRVFNSLGAAGWEMVGLGPANFVCFKRPKKS